MADNRNKDLFIIGDVHGCWHTYKEMLDQWDPQSELLIQLGDLVDRGNFSASCLSYSQEIEQRYPSEALFLKGNHEYMMAGYLKGDPQINWVRNGGINTLESFDREGLNVEDWLPWLVERPLYWQNDAVFVSHAGVSTTPHPFDESNPEGVLWTRGPLKDIGRVQVIGHTPQLDGKATFSGKPPCWNVDTGAFKGICLTGLKLDHNGNFKEEINIPTKERDYL